jgi:hypothetical protein
MSVLWFFIGYVLGLVICMGAIHFGTRLAERRAQMQKHTTGDLS